jgi:hypothetical protein
MTVPATESQPSAPPVTTEPVGVSSPGSPAAAGSCPAPQSLRRSPDPSSGPPPATSAAAPSTVPAAGGGDGDRGEAVGPLATWWGGLTVGRRVQLLARGEQDLLPQSIAVDLTRRGVPCPLTLVSEGPRLVRRAVPPAELVTFLRGRRLDDESVPR